MSDFLVVKSGRYYVRLDIPEDARDAFGGRSVMSKSLKTQIKTEAHVRKLPYLHLWKTEIEKFRRKECPDFREEVSMIVEKFKPKIKKEESAAFNWVNPEIVTPASVERANEIGKVIKSYRLKSKQVEEVASIVAGFSDYSPKTPFFKTRLEAFHNYELNQRQVDLNTVDRHIKRIKAFDAFLKEKELELDYDAVSAFLVSKNLQAKTKKQYLFSFNAFYNYIIKKEPSFKDKFPSNPFKDHELNQVRRGITKKDKRRAFSIEEINLLHAKAIEQEKKGLADLIEIGAYTGARIEEICKLKTSSVINVDGIDCFDITEGKNQASVRHVPIAGALMPTVKRLVEASTDGYLLKSSAGGKYGTKSKSLGNNFSLFKTSLGFGKDSVFHSVRKTVITTLERADVKNLVIIALVGHKADGLLSMTFDRYSEGPTPAAKLNAVEHLKYKFSV